MSFSKMISIIIATVCATAIAFKISPPQKEIEKTVPAVATTTTPTTTTTTLTTTTTTALTTTTTTTEKTTEKTTTTTIITTAAINTTTTATETTATETTSYNTIQKLTKVIATDTVVDVVTVEDYFGNLYYFSGVEDWFEGDGCILEMRIHPTEEEDPEIIRTTYTAWELNN